MSHDTDAEQVVALRWYPAHMGPSGREAVIGFVALIDRRPGHPPYFKVYIGVASGLDGEGDAFAIAHFGAPILDEAMARHLAGPRWKKLAYAS